jgi:asparagine synthase (glutamine-hydrolysing)
MVHDVICYIASIEGSTDIAFARSIAKNLKLKLRVNKLTRDEVEQMIPEIINVIENTNAGQVGVAVPVYAAINLAHEYGIKVLYTGQLKVKTPFNKYINRLYNLPGYERKMGISSYRSRHS